MYFNNWKKWFACNAVHFSHINWEQKDELTPVEKKLISQSLQQFQRGENSEGKHLFQFAKNTGDTSYLETIKLFIKEEQTHAAVLGKYLDKHQIPRIKNHWVDGVFRFLRKLSGIEVSIRVLLAAEIIAKVYYEALLKATQSPVLKLICEQILSDEIKHIHFQCYAINRFTICKPFLYKSILFCLHYILMRGTITVVWWHHRRVLIAGGLSYSQFSYQNLNLFRESVAMIEGKIEIPKAVESNPLRA